MKWHWSKNGLETQWSLSADELALLPSRIGSGRLGCAILLKFFQFQGFFPTDQKSIPHEIVVYVASVTNSTPEDPGVYECGGRTGQCHRKKISSFWGLCRPAGEDLQRLLRVWLIVEILPQDVSFDRLQEMAVEWFVKHMSSPDF